MAEVGRDLWGPSGICPLGATLQFLSFDSIPRAALGLLVLVRWYSQVR